MTDTKQKYKKYLQTEVWQGLKNEAIERAGGRCQLCNSSDSLHVHHRVYPKVWGDELISDLTVLCNSCHFVFHFKPRSLPKRTDLFHTKPDNSEHITIHRAPDYPVVVPIWAIYELGFPALGVLTWLLGILGNKSAAEAPDARLDICQPELDELRQKGYLVDNGSTAEICFTPCEVDK